MTCWIRDLKEQFSRIGTRYRNNTLVFFLLKTIHLLLLIWSPQAGTPTETEKPAKTQTDFIYLFISPSKYNSTRHSSRLQFTHPLQLIESVPFLICLYHLSPLKKRQNMAVIFLLSCFSLPSIRYKPDIDRSSVSL